MEPNMDHGIYIGMSEPVRKTHTFLWDDTTMASEIDRVITEGVKSRLPVFIYIPVDVVAVQLDATRLETPLDIVVKNKSSAVEDEIVKNVLDLIKTAENPIVLADVLTIRHGGRELARKLVDLTNFPSFSTPLSKGIIDEDKPNYGGTYNGKGDSMHRLSSSTINQPANDYSLPPQRRRCSARFRPSPKPRTPPLRFQHRRFLARDPGFKPRVLRACILSNQRQEIRRCAFPPRAPETRRCALPGCQVVQPPKRAED